jgi:hypothetical protein
MLNYRCGAVPGFPPEADYGTSSAYSYFKDKTSYYYKSNLSILYGVIYMNGSPTATLGDENDEIFISSFSV